MFGWGTLQFPKASQSSLVFHVKMFLLLLVLLTSFWHVITITFIIIIAIIIVVIIISITIGIMIIIITISTSSSSLSFSPSSSLSSSSPLSSFPSPLPSSSPFYCSESSSKHRIGTHCEPRILLGRWHTGTKYKCGHPRGFTQTTFAHIHTDIDRRHKETLEQYSNSAWARNQLSYFLIWLTIDNNINI